MFTLLHIPEIQNIIYFCKQFNLFFILSKTSLWHFPVTIFFYYVNFDILTFLHSNLLLHEAVVIINGNKSLKVKFQSTLVRSWWNTTVLKRIIRFYVRKSLANCCYEIALNFINQIYSNNISTSNSVILSLYFILVINSETFYHIVLPLQHLIIHVYPTWFCSHTHTVWYTHVSRKKYLFIYSIHVQ